MITLKTRSEVKVKVTQKWYLTLRHPKMHPHIKFGIPTSKNIGDMHRTQSGTDGWTDIVITIKTDTKRDGQTVGLLYASKNSFGGIKTCTSVQNLNNKYVTLIHLRFDGCLRIGVQSV